MYFAFFEGADRRSRIEFFCKFLPFLLIALQIPSPLEENELEMMVNFAAENNLRFAIVIEDTNTVCEKLAKWH